MEAAGELRARLRLPAADAALAGGGAGAAQALREALLLAHLRQKADGGGEVAACLRAEREALLEASPALLLCISPVSPLYLPHISCRRAPRCSTRSSRPRSRPSPSPTP